ncbi:MAG: hypothetical protein IJZ39_06220 [Oscillospiraceae bacterium]|nr:hypothetical protein [Oscillospiraceae bacterium]
MIRNFEDFCRELNQSGFSMGGGNAKGIFALIDYDWTNQDALDTPVKWHCGDPEVDPWEWRMRVLEERRDVAYSKVFFKTSGFITREWYPHFYAVRRNGESFAEAYERGAVSHPAKRIYDIVSGGDVALHEIKALGGFGKAEKSQFDRAMVELQMGMFITMTGRKQKKNKYGIEYGWNSTVFATVESFWAERGVEIPALDADESYEKIREQILLLNPMAEEKTIRKFIRG